MLGLKLNYMFRKLSFIYLFLLAVSCYSNDKTKLKLVLQHECTICSYKSDHYRSDWNVHQLREYLSKTNGYVYYKCHHCNKFTRTLILSYYIDQDLSEIKKEELTPNTRY